MSKGGSHTSTHGPLGDIWDFYARGSQVELYEKGWDISDIDLEVVAQYCWFATKEVSKMDNSNKRNMLYWWYMTNMYFVCGAGHRKDPPACLKAAIRSAYLSDDRWYSAFQPGARGRRKRKTK